MRTSFLPFARPSLGEEEIREVVATLESGWLTTGPRTEKFAELFLDYVGGRRIVSLPLYPGLTDSSQDDVIEAVTGVLAEFGR